MGEIRDYLMQKAAIPPKEWLRREPRETHPEILAAVREVVAEASPLRTLYDDEVEQFVNTRAGDLPTHTHHGTPGRAPLLDQLGHECYIARHIIKDERSAARLQALLGEGYTLLQDTQCETSKRYTIRIGTLYSGYTVPVYGSPKQVTARPCDAGVYFVPKGGRTRGYSPTLALVREGWSE